MPDLTGTKISNTYKRLLQVNASDNEGITSSLQTIQSGDNTNSPLQLSNSTLNVNGTFAIGGVNLTATVSSLNATADIAGSQGYVVVSGTNVYKRTFSEGNGITLSNADGVASNTGIALTSTISNIQSFGASAVSATTITVAKTIHSSIVSAADIRAATVSTAVLKSPSVSITGGSVSLASGEIKDFTATSIAASVIDAATGTFTGVVSASGFAGDGSQLTNVPSAEGGTVQAIKPGTGLAATVNGASATTITVSGTLNVNPNQSFGTVSVSTGLVVPQGAITFSVPVSGTSAVFTGNVSAANVYAATAIYIGGSAIPSASDIAAVSALTKTNLDSITSANTVIAAVSALTSVNKVDIATNVAAITSANTVIGAVSVLTSVNKASIATNVAAITSINSIIGDGGNYATSAELATVSSALATSIGNTNTALATTSAALATSIGNSNTVIGAVSVLTKTNLDAITSINTVVGNVSSTLATSIANVSSTMATSIGNSNTNIAAVSVLTSVNLARIAATSAALATSIGNQLPKAGGTITGTVSAQSVYVSALGANTTATLGKRIRMDGAAVADIVSLTDGATINVDFNNSQNFAVQLGGNRALGNPSNCVPGQTGSFFFIQDGTGSRTLSFGANYKFAGGTAPTLTTTAGITDRLDYIVYSSTAVHAIATLNVSTS